MSHPIVVYFDLPLPTADHPSAPEGTGSRRRLYRPKAALTAASSEASIRLPRANWLPAPSNNSHVGVPETP